MNGLPLLRSASQLRSRVKSWRAFGETVALVPIFGSVHAGHADLIRAAQLRADRVLAARVPPVGAGADTPEGPAGAEEARTLRLADEAGADALYAPARFRPEGFSSLLHVHGLSNVLEGEESGVPFDAFAADVVRLLSQARPDLVVFCDGQYQRYAVARRLALDFDLCPEVIAVEMPRDDDGVHLCDAAEGLTEGERAVAARLWRTLRRAANEIEAGADADPTLDAAADALAEAGDEVEYLELRDEATLEEMESFDPARPARIFAALAHEKMRLTDNVPVGARAENV